MIRSCFRNSRYLYISFVCLSGIMVALSGMAEEIAPPVSEQATIKPVTYPILVTAPDSALFTLALPPLPALCKNIDILFEHLEFPIQPSVWIASLWQSYVQNQELANLSQDQINLSTCLEVCGFSSTAPAGLFIDYTQTAQSASTIVGQCTESMKTGAFPGRMEYAPPSVLFTTGISDPQKAEQTFPRFLGVDPASFTRTAFGFVHISDEWGYFIKDGDLFVTNSEELLKKTLAARQKSRFLYYGTSDCPARTPNDIVLLTRLDVLAKSMPDVPRMLPYLDMMITKFDWLPITQDSLDQYKDYLYPRTSDDPIVTTLSFMPDQIALESRLDLSKHPAYAPAASTQSTVNLSRCIPQDTIGAGFIQWNGAIQDMLASWKTVLPMEVQTTYLPMFEALANQFMTDEVAFSIQPGNPPVVQVWISVKDRAEAAALLDRYTTKQVIPGFSQDAWQYQTGSLQWTITLERTVLYAVSDLTDQTAKEQAAKDLTAKIGDTRTRHNTTQLLPFYQSLEPPVQADNILALVSFNLRDNDAWRPVVMKHDDPTITKWTKKLRELRIGKTVKSNQQNQFAILYINP